MQGAAQIHSFSGQIPGLKKTTKYELLKLHHLDGFLNLTNTNINIVIKYVVLRRTMVRI